MNYIEHTIELRGPACGGRYIDSAMIGALLNRISPLVRGSILMAVLRSSHKSGRPLNELRNACNVEFGGQQAGQHGSTRLDFIAPTLEDAAPRLFEQRSLFEDIAAPDDTGFDLVGKMLSDVTRGNRESERYDSRLLNDLARFGTLLGHGIDTIHLAGHKLEELNRTDITSDVTGSAEALYRATPPSRRVRVAGTLDMLRMSNQVLELVLPNGQRARAVWTADEIVSLRDYLTKFVVIEGSAIFRPSGTLLRIDASAIAPARESDSFFAQLPFAGVSMRPRTEFRRPQQPATGINAIWGVWPGDETEEELLSALREGR